MVEATDENGKFAGFKLLWISTRALEDSNLKRLKNPVKITFREASF